MSIVLLPDVLTSLGLEDYSTDGNCSGNSLGMCRDCKLARRAERVISGVLVGRVWGNWTDFRVEMTLSAFRHCAILGSGLVVSRRWIRDWAREAG